MRPAHHEGVSGFSRTVSGPPQGGHYVQMKTAVVDTIAPKVGANKVRFGAKAEEVAPALLRDPQLSAFSREGLHGGVQTRLAEADLDAAAEARGNAKCYPTKPILDALMERRRKLTAETIDATGKSGSAVLPLTRAQHRSSLRRRRIQPRRRHQGAPRQCRPARARDDARAHLTGALATDRFRGVKKPSSRRASVRPGEERPSSLG